MPFIMWINKKDLQLCDTLDLIFRALLFLMHSFFLILQTMLFPQSVGKISGEISQYMRKVFKLIKWKDELPRFLEKRSFSVIYLVIRLLMLSLKVCVKHWKKGGGFFFLLCIAYSYSFGPKPVGLRSTQYNLT